MKKCPSHCFPLQLRSKACHQLEKEEKRKSKTQVRIIVHADVVHNYFILGRGKKKAKKGALAGNRTRAPRVAGEDSTTEPPVPC